MPEIVLNNDQVVQAIAEYGSNNIFFIPKGVYVDIKFVMGDNSVEAIVSWDENNEQKVNHD